MLMFSFFGCKDKKTQNIFYDNLRETAIMEFEK